MTAETVRHLIGCIILIVYVLTFVIYLNSLRKNTDFWKNYEIWMEMIGWIAIPVVAVALITL